MATCELHTELVKRIDKCEIAIKNLETQDNVLSNQQTRINTKLDFISDMIKDLKKEITKLTEQPAKRWDTLINAGIAGVISLVLSGAITFALTRH
jgi:septal ring factor EnvC (AmiA/AmiB activator)